MRRLVAILLLMVLSVQFTWAAAASYCEHEKDTTTQHVGHHDHQHATNVSPADKAADAPDQDGSKASGTHADCAYCQLSAAKSFSTVALVLPGAAASSPALPPPAVVESHLFERIERPKWQRA
jgi:hypothetical protein